MAKAIFLFFLIIAATGFASAAFSEPADPCQLAFGFDPNRAPEDDGKGYMDRGDTTGPVYQGGDWPHEGHGVFATDATTIVPIEEDVGFVPHDGHGVFATGTRGRTIIGGDDLEVEPETEAEPKPIPDPIQEDDFEGQREGYPIIRAHGRTRPPLIR